MSLKPQPLGLKKSFGFGDRLGLATPGHLASALKFDFAPIFAQQSIREMTRTQRTPDEVMKAAIIEYSHSRFLTDRLSYHISTTAEEVEALKGTAKADLERVYLDERAGRQFLHVTFGSVLTIGTRPSGETFRAAILERLNANASLHEELLVKHFDHHLSRLNAG